MKPILVTGAGGFIGSALVEKLLLMGEKVIGIDNLNDYYDPVLKNSRLNRIRNNKLIDSRLFKFYKVGLENKKNIFDIFSHRKPKIVVNLAAQAGVRYSLINPNSYIQSNLLGFSNLLDSCKNFNVENFIFASSSSIYGKNKKLPFKEKDPTNHPLNLYAATKKSNELIAHTYSNLYGLPTTGLRFFTVYGPWGRPDMAPMIFTKAILSKKPIKIFNYGNLKRDFTYIDDVIEGIVKCCFKYATPDPSFNALKPNACTSNAPYRLFNIGNGNPINIMDFIELLEKKLSLSAIKEFEEMQDGDVMETHADTTLLQEWIDYRPNTNIELGIDQFLNWYLDYFKH